MTTNLDKLEALAKAATPGPWEDLSNHPDHLCGTINKGKKHIAGCSWFETWREEQHVSVEEALANAAYIAAANPTTMLELVAELREARRERDWLASQRHPQGPGDTHGCPNLERYSKCDNVGSFGVHSHKKCRECWLKAAKERR